MSQITETTSSSNNFLTVPGATTSESVSQSPQKSPKDIKRQKKKKTAAFQSFLAKSQASTDIDISASVAKRKMSGEEQILEERIGQEENCKICHLELAEKRKVCQFCKETVCQQHIRKKRKYKNTNKFSRICDDCEDRYLYQKYMKLQMKAEESIASQEIIIGAKHDELLEIINNKKAKVEVLRNRGKQLEEQKKVNDSRLAVGENEVAAKTKKLDGKIKELNDLQQTLDKMAKALPRPLEQDYNSLSEENQKITKQLVKYEKLCNEAIKAKSIREKRMYEEYYEWERKQTEAKAKATAKGEECSIY